jgi:Bacterial regulatory proteins, luxR family
MSDDNPYRPQDVVIHEQPETAVFVNPRGQIVVRQNDYFEGDSAEHVLALNAAIKAAAASPEAGFRQLEEEPELELEPAPERIEDVPQPDQIVDQPDRRELIRAALLAGGKSNRQIAAELNCSEATVRRAAATLTAAECDSQCDSVRLTQAMTHA